MVLTVSAVMFLIALIVFIIGALYAPPRGNLISAGLAFTAAGLLLGGI